MDIRRVEHASALHSPHGEIVYELCGIAAGNSQAHSLAQVVIPPGSASRKHYHPVAEESYLILSGTGDLQLDDEIASLHPGDCVIIPPGCIHQIANHGPGDLVLLAVCAPAWTSDNSVYLD